MQTVHTSECHQFPTSKNKQKNQLSRHMPQTSNIIQGKNNVLAEREGEAVSIYTIKYTLQKCRHQQRTCFLGLAVRNCRRNPTLGEWRGATSSLVGSCCEEQQQHAIYSARCTRSGQKNVLSSSRFWVIGVWWTCQRRTFALARVEHTNMFVGHTKPRRRPPEATLALPRGTIPEHGKWPIEVRCWLRNCMLNRWKLISLVKTCKLNLMPLLRKSLCWIQEHLYFFIFEYQFN